MDREKRLASKKRYREKNKDKIREYNKEYNKRPKVVVRKRLYDKEYFNRPEIKEKARRYAKKYAKKRIKNPVEKVKIRARESLKKAVKIGKIKKPNSCSKCGKISNKEKIDGHHEDYTQPLKVEWLCKKCHRGIHTQGVLLVNGRCVAAANFP